MREQIAAALLDLVANVTWGDPVRGFGYQSQRLQSWLDCPAKPASYLVQRDEKYTQRSGVLPPIRDMEFLLVTYQDVGSDPAHPRPGTENDLMLEAIETRLLQFDTPDQRQTLGGLVHHARIEGVIEKIAGDDQDGQGAMLIPIWVMIP